VKECRSCRLIKPAEEFYKRLSNSDGLYSYCKECTLRKNSDIDEKKRAVYRKKSREYKERNRRAISAAGKKYYLQNRERILRSVTEYRDKNKQTISLKAANKRLKDPYRFEKNRIKHFGWSKENRDRLNEYQREWYQKNKEKRRAHVVLNRAVNSGKVMRPKECSECKKECKPDGHHLDYSKPLEVIWICRACHSRKSPRMVIR
jgi:hypothetical protein